jgi:excisionase family DNA binding protein
MTAASSDSRRTLPGEEQHRDLIEALDNRITIDEVAALLGVHRATVHRWGVAGRLRTLKIGRRTFTTLRDIRAMIESDGTAPGG